MIPKKIHYCWFGGNPLPESAKKCIDSWKKFCPDYEIIEWNENNFDVNCCAYVREAYQAKKWAFVSDVARLIALVTQGGIYMDTDVELIRSLNDLLELEAFVGFENKSKVATCLMACQAEQPLFQELLKIYTSLHFIKRDGTNDQTTNVKRITSCCMQYGLKLDGKCQTVRGVTFFPSDYFSPFDFETGNMHKSDHTYSIHWFDATWYDPASQYGKQLKWKLSKFMPTTMAYNVSKFIAITKYHGLGETFKRAARKVMSMGKQR
ncbi:MAG: glycosyltransferase [Clostridia bacterium]|nr:glycosyltransferase [Clostridia bacterium]